MFMHYTNNDGALM